MRNPRGLDLYEKVPHPRAEVSPGNPSGESLREYIRSWVKGGIFYGDYFDYLSAEKRKEEHFRQQNGASLG
jgi:hypothetical protein